MMIHPVGPKVLIHKVPTVTPVQVGKKILLTIPVLK